MATKRSTKPTNQASSAASPSRRAIIKKGVAIVGAGLVTTVAARDARAAGSWGGGGSRGGGRGNSGGGRGNSGGGRGNSGGGRGNSGGRGRGR